MKNSPTQRSLAKLRAEGWLVAVTERWNPFAKIRQDLFGFIDLLAVRGNETLAVQTTTGPNMAAREIKIRASQAAAIWLESPTRKIVIHGWTQRGPRGKRKLWECRETILHGGASTDTQELPSIKSLRGIFKPC